MVHYQCGDSGHLRLSSATDGRQRSGCWAHHEIIESKKCGITGNRIDVPLVGDVKRDDCAKECLEVAGCKAFSYNKNSENCYLLARCTGLSSHKDYDSGEKVEGAAPESESEVVTTKPVVSGNFVSNIKNSRDIDEHTTKTGWFKTKSESKIEGLGSDGVYWTPVKKPTTIHTYFPKQSWPVGKAIQFSMMWETDGYTADGHDSFKDFDCAQSDITGQGKGISDKYLRCMGGTGDFRVGFFESTDKVEGNTCEGTEENQSDSESEWTCDETTSRTVNKKWDDYKGFQFRMQPHLSKDFQGVRRLYEKCHKGCECRVREPGCRCRCSGNRDKRTEPHINLQMWVRREEGSHGLMSDQCQHSKESHQCGFTKDNEEGGYNAIGFGPNAPFGKAYPVKLVAYRKSDTEYQVRVWVNGAMSPMEGFFPRDFKPSSFDTFAVTYTNLSRRYKYVKISDFKVQEVAWTPIKDSEWPPESD